MNISTLCDKIGLQSEVKARVLHFGNGFDFAQADKQLRRFRDYDSMSDAVAGLQALLGDDPDHIKILTCMLKVSADVYEIYRSKGIGDRIYYDTMKCYPRFIDETYKITGRRCFDRYWWTVRQAGCHLFRIGTLEYEMKYIGGETVIGIHIPSDADLSPPAVDGSLHCAKSFFAEHYPELSNAEYRCHSWLLDRQLEGMLEKGSNILRFQNRFEIFDEGEIGTDHLRWVFHTASTDLTALPENTSLQWKMKEHLLSGGIIRNAYGRLITL